MISDPDEAVEALRQFVGNRPDGAGEFRIQVRLNKPAKFNLGEEIMDEILSVEATTEVVASLRALPLRSSADQVLKYEGRENISDRTIPIILASAKAHGFPVVVSESGQSDRGWLRGVPLPPPRPGLVVEPGETYRLSASNVRKAVPWFWVMLIPYLMLLGPLVELLLLRNNFHMFKEIRRMASISENEVLDISWNADALTASFGEQTLSVPNQGILAFSSANVITTSGFVRIPQVSDKDLMADVAAALNLRAGMN